jgi:hypothetical protein
VSKRKISRLTTSFFISIGLCFSLVTVSKASTTPTITSVTTTSTNGTYAVGDSINIKITFSEQVVIVGNLTITLETGPTDRTIFSTETNGGGGTYTVNATTKDVNFSYTIQHGDRSTDLNYQSTSALLLTPYRWNESGTKSVVATAAGATAADLTLPALNTVNSLAGSAAIIVNGSGGEPEKFQNSHSSASGLHSLILLEDVRENTSWLRGWTPGWGSVTGYCTSFSDTKCDNDPVSFRAVLPKCATGSDTNCIEGVYASSTTVEEKTGNWQRYFPNANNLNITNMTAKKFTSSMSRNIPSGGTSGIYSFTDFPHLGGSEYAVTVRVGGWNEANDSSTSRSFFASINPVSFISVNCDENSHGLCWDDVNGSPGLDQDNGYRCVLWDVVDGDGDGDVRYYQNTGPTGDDDVTTCALKHGFPENLTFRIKVRLSTEPGGWLHGRLTDPSVTFDTTGGQTTVEIQGSPVKVPAVAASSSYSNLPSTLQSWFDTNCTSGSNCSSRFSSTIPVNDNWSSPLKRNVVMAPPPYTPSSFENLDRWRNFIGDSASAVISHWNIRTLSDEEFDDAATCIREGSGVTGIVTTNSTLYSEGPPTFNPSTKVLRYQISSPHYLNDGATEFLGNYHLLVKKSVANCLFGLTGKTLRQSMRVIDEAGTAKNGVNTSITTTGNWFKFSATNITFSDPIIETSLSEDSDASGGGGSGGGTTTASRLPDTSAEKIVFKNPSNIKDSYFKSLTPSQIGTISLDQISKLKLNTVRLITVNQAKNLTNDQIAAMTSTQIKALNPSIFKTLNQKQISALQPNDFRNLTISQISNITAPAAAGLDKADLNAFNQTQVRSLTTTAVKNLEPKVLKSLSVSKLRQFSSRQIRALTAEQKLALTTVQKKALGIK